MKIIDIKNLSDDSITDTELIRKIAIHSIQKNTNEFICKIKRGYEVFGLYPMEVKKLNIKPND